MSPHSTGSTLIRRRAARVAAALALVALPALGVLPASAHNLQTRMVYMFLDPDAQACLDARIEGGPLPAGCAPLPGGWMPGDPILQTGDEVGVIIKVVPRDGTTTGVGGHIDFYVPNGVEVVDVAYVVPDGVGGYDPVAIKGQSLIATGAGPIGARSTAELIDASGWTGYTNLLGVTEAPVVPATGLHRGTIAGVYGDTGIFYATDPDLAYGSWQAFTGDSTANGCGSKAFNPTSLGKTIVNNSGDTVVPCNKWDAEQLMAWGARGGTYGQSAPIVDYGDGRGNAPWGFASGVAGADSGYSWHFDWDEWNGSAKNAAAMRAAMGNDEIGPWKRIRYDGDRIAKDAPGSLSTVLGFANVDAGNTGIPVADLPETTSQVDGTSPKAIRWAVGQLTAFRPEYAWVKVKVTNASAGITGPSGCPVLHGDTFGGDAGGTDNGKDHLWRYYEPTEVRMNLCLTAGKPATEELVRSGDTYQYPVTVYNLQDFPLTNVVVRDTLGGGLTHLSSVPAPNAGPNPLVWNVGTLLPGQRFRALVTVKAGSSGFLDNCVVITSDQLPPQSACDSTISGSYPYLVPTKTASTGAVAPGGTVQYTVRVDNTGTGPTASPVTIQEYLPAGFTFVSKDLVTVNGANVTASTTVCHLGPACNPNLPVFTVPAAINAGQSLILKLTVQVPLDATPGSYCNSYTVTQNGVPLTTGSAACVTVAGGKIGDTVWRDWDGDGTQDPGEEGIAGVTVKLYDGTGTTLLATTVTDASGRYYFPGLVAGSYVVEVNNGAALPGTTQTGDPDSACPSAGCNNRHAVTLATDQQYLTADFGYRPVGTASIGDKVFEDVGNDGMLDVGVDAGIPNVTVRLYEDSNGNGVIDAGDALVATTATNGSGDYLFANLASGYSYLVQVDTTDADLQAYFDGLYGPATPFQPSTAVVTASPSLAGADLDNDFGFWRVQPGSIGDQVFVDTNGNGIYDAGDEPIGAATVTLLRDGQPYRTTETAPDGTYLFGNLGPGSYQVIVSTTDPDLPGGYFPTVGQYAVNLTAGQNYLAADFPFVSLLTKTVDLAYALPGQTLMYSLKPYFPGPDLLENVRVVDPLPAGTTYVGGSANAGGTFGPYVSLPGTAVQDAATALGMAVYNNNNDTFRYRTFNVLGDDTFGAETNGANLGTRIQMMAGASSPTTAERVIAFLDSSRDVYAATWNGTTWAAVPNPPAAASPGRMTASGLTTGSNAFWGAAVGYEQSSGHLMLAWNDDAVVASGNDDEIRFVTRESGTWGTVTSVATANQPQNLRMATRPNSDQMTLSFSTSTGSDYAMVWSGTAWGAIQTLDTTGGSPTAVNAAYEAQSGRSMVVYGKPTATSTSLFYRIWDGVSWSAEASLAPPAGVTSQPQWVAIASDPFSNRIAVGVVTGGSRTWLAVWDGSAWGSVQTATTTSLTAAAQNVAVAFETLSGDLLAAYGVNSAPTAQVRHRTWTWNPVTSSGSWSAEALGPTATSGNPNVVLLARSPATDRVMMTLNTSGNRANYVFWDGSAWDATVLDAGNTQVPTQQPAIYLWNRSTATQGAATSLSATPIAAATGGSVTVKLEFKSITTLTNVTPSLVPLGGSATCTTGDTIPATVSAGVLRTFTYTCTPTTLGEIRFFGEGMAADGYELPSAESNSVLVSPDGSSSVVTWSLGSNAAGVPGETIDSGVPAGIYGFRGAGQPTFSRYGIGAGAWVARANAPNNIAKGGALTSDGVSLAYGLRGGGQQTFYSYNANTNAWTTLANTGVNVDEGGALQYLEIAGVKYVFALMGNGTAFRRYSVVGNTWAAMAATPNNVKKGGALATDGTYLYALRGDRKNSFWRCNATTSGSAGSCDTSWTAMANVPANVGWGGALVRLGNYLYAFRGDGKREFYRYNIAANTWTAMALAPGNVSDGGALATDGTNVYGFQGKTTGFWRYNVAANSWTTLAAFAANTGQGGALTYLPSIGVQGRTTSIAATPMIVSVGNTAQVVLSVGSSVAVNNVVPSALTQIPTGGATASCSGPVPASQNIPAGGTVTFVWSCAVTPGTVPGSLRFSASATGSGPVVFPSATSNGVIVSPVLTFQATVNNPAPTSGVVNDTGLLVKDGAPPNTYPSNTVQTATAGSIGDYVWADLDGDGVQDPEEYGLDGVRVYLDANANGVWDAGEPFDLTDALGGYRIFGLPAGNYTVRTDPATYPDGFLPTTPVSIPVVLSAGQQVSTADFGLEPPGTGSIGDTVWLDVDRDGVLDAGEGGLSGITVTLEILIAGTWTPVATAVTDGSGAYLFDGLIAGQYRVTVDDASQVSSPYAAGTFDLGDVMTPTFDADGTGTPHVALVTLATDTTDIATVDFGYDWSGSIGDYVWWDDDLDGLQDEPASRAIEGARVELYVDVDGDGVFTVLGGDYELRRVFTDAAGAYQFQGLPPGTYIVNVYEDSLTSGGVRDVVPTTDDLVPVTLGPGGMTDTTADFGYFEGARVEGTVWHDANRNGLIDGGEVGLAGVEVTLTGTDEFGNAVTEVAITDAFGRFFFLVPEGDYTLTYSTPDVLAVDGTLTDTTTPTEFTFHAYPGEDWHPSFDFGVDNAGAIGDRVWNDADAGDDQDPGEPGLPGVTVDLIRDTNNDNLWDPDGVDNIAGNADDEVVLDSQATDASGNYLFDGLPDGNYLVRVDSATLPSGYAETFDNSGSQADHLGQADISAGNTVDTVDFGYQPPVNTYTVTGTVWDDDGSGGGTEGNGTKDGAEPGLPGVTVCLYDSAGTTVVACTTTDANGNYAFPGIPNGTYIVRVDPDTLPSDAYVQTGDPDSACPAAGCNDESSVTVLNANPPAENFGYLEQLGSISGYVVAGDGDGQRQVGEPAVAGTLVVLTDAGPDGIIGTADDIVRTTTTDANGYYEFTGLQPGLYQIVKTNPDGTVALADRDGGNPNSISVDLAPGGTNVTTRDFEIGSSIGDLVWLDTDGDGVHDIGEPGIGNVDVQLYDVGPDGNPGGGDDILVATTTTDADGGYLFDAVARGDYYVDVVDATVPAGLTPSPGTFDPTAEINFTGSAPYLDADFGYTGPAGTALIGDFVWSDADGDGTQDPGEVGIAGVTIELKGPGTDGILGTGDDTVVDTATTDATGHYLFTGVAAGEYLVDVTDTGNVLTGYTLTSGPQASADPTAPILVAAGDVYLNADFGFDKPMGLHSIADTVWFDADGDGLKDVGEAGIPGVTVNLLDGFGTVIATTTTAADGSFAFDGLPDGSYTLEIGDVDGVLVGHSGTTPDAIDGSRPIVLAGSDVTGVHFGYNLPGSVGDTVWSDADADGVQDPGEPGIAGVQVMIFRDTNGDGVFDSTVDALVATATTDAAGNYLVPGLPIGTYFASIDPAQVALSGYTATTTDQELGGNAAGIQIEAALPLGGASYLDADFGFTRPALADVSGSVWNDLDKDGVDDGAGEPPIPGVTVVLVDDQGNVVATTTTDVNGDYTFPDVAPGDYTVTVTDAAGVLDGYEITSGLDEIPVTVGAIDITGVDFGYVRDPETGSIGDFVWLDVDGDGVQDGAEGGIGAVTVDLYEDTDGDGVLEPGGDDGGPVATTVTDASGQYRFDGLPAGNYYVQVDPTTLPNGGTGLAETTGGLDNLSSLINLSDGEWYPDADLGYSAPSGQAVLGDWVWYDVDGDSIQDDGEVGVGGVSISVTGPGCSPCLVTTDPDGSWLVPGLTPGATYTVVLTPPAGYTITNGSATRTYTMPTTPEPIMDILYADFGLVCTSCTGTVGDRIWRDTDGDGMQDAGEPGIGGVTVNLVSGGAIVATTTTAPDGSYAFVGVPPGSYTVVVSDLDGLLGGLNQTGDPNEPGTPCTTCDDSYAVTVTAGGSVTDADFGYAPTFGSIGNLVWHDVDGDGLYEPKGADGLLGTADDETPIEGVEVQLWVDVNGNGLYDAGIDNLVRTATTDADGLYEFLGLPAGAYLVDVAPPSGFTLTDGLDGFDSNSQVDMYPVALTSVSARNLTADFGFEATTAYSISGTVFNDQDNDGLLDWPANDQRIPNIPVYLYVDLDGDGVIDPTDPLIATHLSDDVGGYLFTDLPPGDYIVSVDATGSRLDGFYQTTQIATDAVQPVTIGSTDVTDQDFGFYAPTPVQTTPVTLSSFRAERRGDAVRFTWTTATETGNVGFHLFEETADGLRRINDRLIASRQLDSMSTTAYVYEATGVSGSRFAIQDVDLRARTRTHGTFDLDVAYGSADDAEPIDWDAIRAESDRLADERAADAAASAAALIAGVADSTPDVEADVDAGPTAADGIAAAPPADARASAVARLTVSRDGMVRVTYEQLKAAGIDLRSVGANKIAIAHRGQPVPVRIDAVGSKFGPGSSLEFYGEAADGLYTRANAYDVVLDGRLRRAIGTLRTSKRLSGTPATSYVETAIVDENRAYGTSSPSDDPWYEFRMIVYGALNTWQVPVQVDHLAPGPAELRLWTWGGTDWAGGPDHHLAAAVNGQPVIDGRFDGLAAFEPSAALPDGVLREGANTVSLLLPGDTGFDYDLINFDRLELRYPRSLVARDGRLSFEARAPLFRVTGLTSADVRVYRFEPGKDPVRYDAVAATAEPGGTFAATFEGSSAAARYEVLSVPSLAPAAIAPLGAPGDLALDGVDYLMISHPDFRAGIQPLADHHRARGLAVKVVDVRDVYDRHSGGVVDPLAIKAYVAEAHATGARFVLLVGGDTYDYFNYVSSGAMSFVPTLYARTDPIVHYAPVDPKFADVDDDGVPDLALGRFPVRTATELAHLVAKTLAYETKAYGGTAVFAADARDPLVDFTADSESFIAQLPDGWSVDRAHIDQVGWGTARANLLAAVNQGRALTSYVGHSSATAWTFNGLFRSSDATTLTNAGRPTVVAQWGCWNTYFVSPLVNTLGNAFLLSGDRGAAAVLGASTLTESRSEELLGALVLPRMTQPGTTVGEAVLAAKHELAATHDDLADVLLGWTLLGDPALAVEP